MIKDRTLAAIAAFEKVECTGIACLDHPKTCWICRIRFLERFLPCLKWKHLWSEFVKAKADSEPYRAEFGNLKLGPDATPSAEWLENLYKL